MNPFDDPEATYVVLVNDEGQFSLWPEFAGTPDGWRIAHPAADRTTCLDFIEENWTDLRPASLVREMRATATRSS
ncbi:MbtH family protein [Kitasatospora sp. NPDC058115]|uniref:MbtH family protein n=1 Tax=Kitasatospora sp. NPDC058115 TaxID=3346347 RepID=UPI0036DD19ED